MVCKKYLWSSWYFILPWRLSLRIYYIHNLNGADRVQHLITMILSRQVSRSPLRWPLRCTCSAVRNFSGLREVAEVADIENATRVPKRQPMSGLNIESWAEPVWDFSDFCIQFYVNPESMKYNQPASETRVGIFLVEMVLNTLHQLNIWKLPWPLRVNLSTRCGIRCTVLRVSDRTRTHHNSIDNLLIISYFEAREIIWQLLSKFI